MEFSTHEDELLLKLVRVKPQLYNSKLDEYKDVPSKQIIWQNIGKAMNKSSKDCKKRWKHIKDSYNRFKRTSRSSTATSRRNTKWRLYEQLSFLETGYYQPSPEDTDTLIVVKENNSDTDELSLVENTLSDRVVNGVFLDENVTNYDSETSVDSSTHHESEDALLSNIKDRLENPEPLPNSMPRKKDDEINSFCSHIGDVLRALPPLYKIRAKQEIFNIITNYEIMVTKGVDNPP